MAKEWILNLATNRWGLNKKDKVGPVSEWIRECSPKNLEEWKTFYFNKLESLLKDYDINISPEEYLNELGRRLYVKISEVLQKEIEEVTEEDCIQYIYNLVINRTFEGYINEIVTVYKLLEKELGEKIEPAPDKWDRKYNVDFYIKIGENYIGLQIKPITYKQTLELHKWIDWLKRTHKRFEKDIGGKVFIIFSIKKDNKKEVYNKEIISEIKKEIERLRNL